MNTKEPTLVETLSAFNQIKREAAIGIVPNAYYLTIIEAYLIQATVKHFKAGNRTCPNKTPVQK